MQGKIIIFSAPSGSGKSTIISRLMSRRELNMACSISCTSRPPRGTERDGVEYFFVTPDEFRRRIEAGEFLEYEEVYKDRYYGTLKSQVESQLDRGENVVLDVDVKGGCSIKSLYGDRALSLFIQPPSVGELRRRLDMVRLALAGEPRMQACDYEFRLPRPSYMWHTLSGLSRDYPDREFVLLIGADNWARFDEWYASREILARYRVAVYPREGISVAPAQLPPGVMLADTGLIPGSSTEVRRRLGCGLPVDGLVPPAVAEYIEKNRLYRP